MLNLQEAWRDGKEFKICTVDLKFELGRASLIKVWDNRDFTRSPKLIKYIFRDARIQKQVINNQVLVFIIGIKNIYILLLKRTRCCFFIINFSLLRYLHVFILFYFILFGIERILVNHCFYQSRSLNLGINSTYGV
jgi:hypothetical protein